VWSLTLREKYRLKLTENGELKKILGPKREEIMGVANTP